MPATAWPSTFETPRSEAASPLSVQGCRAQGASCTKPPRERVASYRAVTRSPILKCWECAKDAGMRQSPGKLSTEARIYAKNLAYEIARRERIGAPALDPGGKATTWRDAQVALRHAFMDEGSPPRRVKLLDAAATRLERLPPSDRGFRIALFWEGNRQATILICACWCMAAIRLKGWSTKAE